MLNVKCEVNEYLSVVARTFWLNRRVGIATLLCRRSTRHTRCIHVCYIALQTMLFQFLADIPASTMTINTTGKHKYRTPHNTTLVFFIN